MEGILYDSSSNYDGLLRVIASQIGLDIRSVELVIQYVVDVKLPPLTIHNDMGVKVYLGQRRWDPNSFSKYPLCVSYNTRDIDPTTHLTSDEVVLHRDMDLPVDSWGESDDENGEFEEFHDDQLVIKSASIDIVMEGQIYLNKHVLNDVMQRYALVRHFQFRVVRSCKSRFSLRCADEKCTWYFKSSSVGVSEIFKVRLFNDSHTCGGVGRLYARNQCYSSVLGTMLLPKFNDPRTIYTPRDIKADMRTKHGISMTYMQAWRCRQKAINILRGDPMQSYSKLPIYLHILAKSYPGSVVNLKKTNDNKFLYSFIALDGSIRGWEYCRPIVVVDGTHIRSTFEGTMLIATTMDPGGHILPLAYGIADSENDNSWRWFFENFKIAFGERDGMCFVSDRNQSIWNAAASVYAGIQHYACIYHLWTNLLKFTNKHIDEVRKLFFSLAKAYTIEEFNTLMDRMDNINPKIRPYLERAGFEKWSRCHASVKRTWTLTSNIAESFNNAILPGRRLPVIPMLEYVRQTIQRWNEKNNEEGRTTTTVLTRKYNKLLVENMNLSNGLTVRASTTHLHTVLDGAKRFIVCLNTRKCSCGQFQLDEMPCCHAISAIEFRKLRANDFCSVYYSNKNFLDAYAIPIEPLPCESTWEVPPHVMDEIVLPPSTKRRPGRPSNKDRKGGFSGRKAKRSKGNHSVIGQEGRGKKDCNTKK